MAERNRFGEFLFMVSPRTVAQIIHECAGPYNAQLSDYVAEVAGSWSSIEFAEMFIALGAIATESISSVDSENKSATQRMIKSFLDVLFDAYPDIMRSSEFQAE